MSVMIPGVVASSVEVEVIPTFEGIITEGSAVANDSLGGTFAPPVVNGDLQENSNLAIDSASGSRTVPAFSGAVAEISNTAIDSLMSSVATVAKVVSTGTENLYVGLSGSFPNFSVNWGDGVVQNNLTSGTNHIYTAPGEYTVVIVRNSGPTFLEIFGPALTEVLQIALNISRLSFFGHYPNPNFTTIVNYLPPNITSCEGMFTFCENFNSDISNWDVSNVTNMFSMFNNCSSFNSDISNWNVSNVTSMQDMFSYCSSFNSDISNWNVSNVTDMDAMFTDCSVFNQDLSGWCVSNIPTEPSNFSLFTPAWVLPKPVWGTCPGG